MQQAHNTWKHRAIESDPRQTSGASAPRLASVMERQRFRSRAVSCVMRATNGRLSAVTPAACQQERVLCSVSVSLNVQFSFLAHVLCVEYAVAASDGGSTLERSSTRSAGNMLRSFFSFGAVGLAMVAAALTCRSQDLRMHKCHQRLTPYVCNRWQTDRPGAPAVERTAFALQPYRQTSRARLASEGSSSTKMRSATSGGRLSMDASVPALPLASACKACKDDCIGRRNFLTIGTPNIWLLESRHKQAAAHLADCVLLMRVHLQLRIHRIRGNPSVCWQPPLQDLHWSGVQRCFTAAGEAAVQIQTLLTSNSKPRPDDRNVAV